MGVYIKGMEMPKSCPCKLVGVGYDMHCAFVSGIPSRVREYYECCEKGTRPNWCPLVDVPAPHGDLIDAFAFRREMDANYPFDKFTQSKHGEADAAKSTILRMLVKAPTIIKAEE